MYLVNTRQVKTVPGRKSDVLDCQWLHQLMSYGRLEGAYRPVDEVWVMRVVVRHRETLLQEQARQVQRMQKSLVQLNEPAVHRGTHRCGGTHRASYHPSTGDTYAICKVARASVCSLRFAAAVITVRMGCAYPPLGAAGQCDREGSCVAR